MCIHIPTEGRVELVTPVQLLRRQEVSITLGCCISSERKKCKKIYTDIYQIPLGNFCSYCSLQLDHVDKS